MIDPSGFSTLNGVFSGPDRTGVLGDTGVAAIFGRNADGELGFGGVAGYGRGVDAAAGRTLATLPKVGVSRAVRVVSGMAMAFSSTCLLHHDGAVICYGRGATGHTGRTANSDRPDRVDPLPWLNGALGRTALMVAAGGHHYCAILATTSMTTLAGYTAGGDVVCWGSNTHGQLGLDHTFTVGSSLSAAPLGNPAVLSPSAIVFSSTDPVISLDLGLHHSCGLFYVLASGLTLPRCWGRGAEGQLGRPVLEDVGAGTGSVPMTALVYVPFTPVSGHDTVLDVAAGFYHTCAIFSSSGDVSTTVRCFGANENGQLGVDTSTNVTTALTPPLSMGALCCWRTAMAIEAGANHTCAMIFTRNVAAGATAPTLCWGSGSGSPNLLGTGSDVSYGPGSPGPSMATNPGVDFLGLANPMSVTTTTYESLSGLFRVVPSTIILSRSTSFQVHGPPGFLRSYIPSGCDPILLTLPGTATVIRSLNPAIHLARSLVLVLSDPALGISAPAAGFYDVVFETCGQGRRIVGRIELVAAPTFASTAAAPMRSHIGGSPDKVVITGTGFVPRGPSIFRCAWRSSSTPAGYATQVFSTAVVLSATQIRCESVPGSPAAGGVAVSGLVSVSVGSAFCPFCNSAAWSLSTPPQVANGDLAGTATFVWDRTTAVAATPSVINIEGGTTVTLTGLDIKSSPTVVCARLDFVLITPADLDASAPPPFTWTASNAVAPGNTAVTLYVPNLRDFVFNSKPFRLPSTQVLLSINLDSPAAAFGPPIAVTIHEPANPLAVRITPGTRIVRVLARSFPYFRSGPDTIFLSGGGLAFTTIAASVPSASVAAWEGTYPAGYFASGIPGLASVGAGREGAYSSAPATLTLFSLSSVTPPLFVATVSEAFLALTVSGSNFPTHSPGSTCTLSAAGSPVYTFVATTLSATRVRCSNPPAPTSAQPFLTSMTAANSYTLSVVLSGTSVQVGPDPPFVIAAKPTFSLVTPAQVTSRQSSGVVMLITVTGASLPTSPITPLCSYGPGSTSLSASVSSSTAFTCPVPANSALAGPCPVLFSPNNGYQWLDTGLTVTYTVIYSVVPAWGPSGAATTLTLYGDGFAPAGATTCRFTFDDGTGSPPVAYVLGASLTPPPRAPANSAVACVLPARPNTVPSLRTVTVEASAETNPLTAASAKPFARLAQPYFTYGLVAAQDPVLGSITPPSGPAVGSTASKPVVVTVAGSLFPSAPPSVPAASLRVLCRFTPSGAAQPAPAIDAVSYTPASVLCRLPAGIGSSAVDVSFNSGVSFTASALAFTHFTIVQVTPSVAPTSGGYDITIRGSGFSTASARPACLFGTDDPGRVTPATVLSSDRATCPVPTSLDGLALGLYSVGFASEQPPTSGFSGWSSVPLALSVGVLTQNTPILATMTPLSGPPTGTTVTLDGTYFYLPTPATDLVCLFDGTTKVTGTFSSPYVTCPVPFGSGQVTVQVSFNGGSVFTAEAPVFAYYDLYSISPVAGPDVGGTIVTLSGSGFLDSLNLVCFFGTITAPAVYVSDFALTCAAPPAGSPSAVGSPASVGVSIVVDGGAPTTPGASTTFWYYATPTVTAVSPLSVPTSGMVVTVRGSAFPGPIAPLALYCRFGGVVTPASSVTGAGTATSSCLCTAPVGSAPLAVDISGNSGADFNIEPLVFLEYFSLTTARPTLGPSSSGFDVEITGFGFTIGSTTGLCRFSTSPTPLFTAATVVNSIVVSCPAPPPPVPVGAVNISYSPDNGVLWSDETLAFTFFVPPTVSAVTPVSVPGAGAVITVLGSGFVDFGPGQPLCRVAAQSTPAVIISTGSLTCLAPSGAGPAQVRVSLSGGFHFSVTYGTFSYFNVFSVRPAFGPESGSAMALTVSGTGFINQPGIMCSITGAGSSPAVFLSSTLVSCTLVPRGAAPAVTAVELDLGGGIVSDAGLATFSYYPDPAVTSCTPIGGPASGGVPVTVYGQGFLNVCRDLPRCRFGKITVPATSAAVETSPAVPARAAVLSANGTVITPAAPAAPAVHMVVCVSPPSSALVTLSVSTNGGAFFSASNVTYSSFSILSVEPSTGPSAGGTIVIIRGSGFTQTPIAKCVFGVIRVDALVLSPTDVRCSSPEFLPGTVTVEFVVDAANPTAYGKTFSYYATPVLTAISPLTTPVDGGGNVTLYGSNFFNATTLLPQIVAQFGIRAAKALALVPGGVVFAAPPGGGTVSVDVSFNAGVHYTRSNREITYYSFLTFSPARGPQGGGVILTVAGTGFRADVIDVAKLGFCALISNSTRYLFPASFVSPSRVRCVFPSPVAVAPGDYGMAITENGADLATAPTLFTVFPDPTVTALSPMDVPALGLGDTWVTLIGTNFPPSPNSSSLPNGTAETSWCQFGILKGLAFRYISPTMVACRNPRSNGLVQVTLTFNEGFSFHAGPSLNHFLLLSFTPATGPIPGSPTTPVIVTGSRFFERAPGTITCSFGGQRYPGTLLSSTQISCPIPPYSPAMVTTLPPPPSSSGNASSVGAVGSLPQHPQTRVVVFGVSTSGVDFSYPPVDAPVPFVYTPVPNITAVVPNKGHTSGLYEVTVHGSDFTTDAAMACKFGLDLEAAFVPAVVLNSSRLVCRPTPHPDGLVDVVLSYNRADIHYTNGTAFAYERCYPGTVSPSLTTPCTPCPPGQFSEAVGSKQCTPCSQTSYSALPGSTACLPCPDFTNIPVHPRDALEKCTCSVGYFLPRDVVSRLNATLQGGSNATASGGSSGNVTTAAAAAAAVVVTATTANGTNGTASNNNSTAATDISVAVPASASPPALGGVACLSCPRGGTCSGAADPPLARAGYWSSPDNPATFLKCDNTDACRGGSAGECGPGYADRLCGACLHGYYKVKGYCDVCPPTKNWRMMFYVFFAFALAGFLIKKVGKRASTAGGIVGITCFFMQVLGMLRRIDLSLPISFRLTLDFLTMPFTLDLDGLAPECGYPAPFHVKWGLMWFIPLIFVFIFAFEYLLMALYVCIFHRRAAERLDFVEVGAGQSTESTIADTPSTVEDVGNRAVNGYIMFFTLVYILPVTKSLEIFDCTIREDGKLTLDASPNLLCREPWWMRVAPVAAVGIVFYVFLVPLGVVMLLKRNSHRLKDPAFLTRYGSLYVDYHQHVPFWEAVQMVQKCALLFSILLFSSYPDFQIAIFLLVMFLGLSLQLLVRPYFLERYNVLQTLLRWTSCLLLLMGIAIHANAQFYQAQIKRKKAADRGIIVMCFTVLAAGLGFVAAAYFFDITRIHFEIKKRVKPGVMVLLERLMHPHGRTDMIQWFGKGSIGQDFDVPLFQVLNSIAVDFRKRTLALRGASKAERGEILLQSRAHAGLDKFLDLFCGSLFLDPVVPVVREWLIYRVVHSKQDISCYADLSMFGEVFSQFNRFQRSLRASRSYFFRQKRFIVHLASSSYRELLASPQGDQAIRATSMLLNAIFPIHMISKTCFTGIQKQVLRGEFEAFDRMLEAHSALHELLVAELGVRATVISGSAASPKRRKAKRPASTLMGATQVYGSKGAGGGNAGGDGSDSLSLSLSNDDDDDDDGDDGVGLGGGGGGGGGGDSDSLDLDDVVSGVGRSALRSSGSLRSVNSASLADVGTPQTKKDMSLLVSALYEGVFTPLVINRFASQIMGTNNHESVFILDNRSSMPQLHYMFTSTRDERDEDNIKFSYQRKWVRYRPEVHGGLNEFPEGEVAHISSVPQGVLDELAETEGIADLGLDEEDDEDEEGDGQGGGKKKGELGRLGQVKTWVSDLFSSQAKTGVYAKLQTKKASEMSKILVKDKVLAPRRGVPPVKRPRDIVKADGTTAMGKNLDGSTGTATEADQTTDISDFGLEAGALLDNSDD